MELVGLENRKGRVCTVILSSHRGQQRKPNPTCRFPKLRMNANGWNGLGTAHTEPSPRHAHRTWNNTPRNLPVLERKDNGAVNGYGEATVSSSEND